VEDTIEVNEESALVHLRQWKVLKLCNSTCKT
jgi:hypothetical protein